MDLMDTTAARGLALDIDRLGKRFGNIAAIDDVSLQLARGEIFALIGENGAGKTTLMNLVYGLYRPDAGHIRAFGQPLQPGSTSAAIAAGIGMVHQHFMLVPTLTVAENVVLGNEPRRLGCLLDRKAAVRLTERTADALGFALDPRALVRDIGVGMQQRVEIVKALCRGARLLIFDEPTANLTPQEADELYAIVRRLRDSGTTVVFITHKLREVIGVADRVGVMRRGKLVSIGDAKDATPRGLSNLMVGASVELGQRHPATAVAQTPIVALDRVSARDAQGHPALNDVSFDVRPGEILAVAGVDGNGQAELVEVLSGLCALTAGTILFDGQDVSHATPARLRALGLAHIPADRLHRGLCPNLQLTENLALGRARQAPFAKGPFIDRRRATERASALIERFDIRPPDPRRTARELSGGNQQKVILARELDQKP
ncbi:MAG: ABC transporter ATP-binding protein, partial [Myxococcales bacterium]|nr:ABC transporter ATP-binding protein [Myxococcales bacterium]